MIWLAMIGAALGAPPALKVGAAKVDITPTYPVSINGGMWDHAATRSADPLHARCLALDDGKTKIAIVVVDSCMVPRGVHDAARKLILERTAIPGDHVLISATHTHSAPSLAGTFQSGANENYVAALPGMIADGVAKAFAARSPATFGWGVARHPEDVFNRRWFLSGDRPLSPFGTADEVRMNPGDPSKVVHPAGPIDPDVTVLAFQGDAGLRAAMGHYPLHYVGGVPGDVTSADYFGMFSERIGPIVGKRRPLEPGFVGLLSNGASGNINNINFRVPGVPRKPFEQMRLVAERVAASADQALATAKFADAKLGAREVELQLGVRKPTAERLAWARGVLGKLKDGRLTTMEHIYAREATILAGYPDTVPVRVQASRIGDLAIVAIPCEVFVEIGLHLKQASPFERTIVMPLANGYNGYLPTREHFALGGYETWAAQSSYLAEDAAERIVASALESLKLLSMN